MANTPAAEEVLNGSYKCTEDTDTGTIDLFREIAII
jgi:hypothetical protein